MTVEKSEVPQAEIDATASAAKGDPKLVQDRIWGEDWGQPTAGQYVAPQGSFGFIIRPLGDRVVVKRLVEEEKTKGGIYIPTQAKEKPLEGIVLAVGEGRTLESGIVVPVPFQVGSRIIFSKYAGSEIRIAGEDLLLLNVSDIQGVYNWDPAELEPVEFPIQAEVGILPGITPPEESK